MNEFLSPPCSLFAYEITTHAHKSTFAGDWHFRVCICSFVCSCFSVVKCVKKDCGRSLLMSASKQ